MSEKTLLPSATGIKESTKSPSATRKVIQAIALAAVGLVYLWPTYFKREESILVSSGDVCYQPPVLFPSQHATTLSTLEGIYSTDDFLLLSAERLGAAVRVETESYDDFGPVGSDPRWDKFANLHDVLRDSFPAVHAHLELTLVNTWAIVLEWKGFDDTLKPLLLTSHQDVVPVLPSTVGSWTHPPYSGYFDGTYIWGRGSSDAKSNLVGILSAVESLLTHTPSFKPKRTVVLAFGIDEEASGKFGASYIGEYLVEHYGRKAFGLLVDEGLGYVEMDGATIAPVGTGEKGYMDVALKVETLGGHSSIPPEHTSIGLLSLMIAALEKKPHPANLTRSSPFYGQLQCSALYSPLIPSSEATLIHKSATCDGALKKLNEIKSKDKTVAHFIKTTQAVDIIHGGVKVNALPETAEAVINHRINTASSVFETQEHIISALIPIISSFNLTFTSFNTSILSGWPSAGHVSMNTAFGKPLKEPSAPTVTGKGVKAFEVLAGTIKGVHMTRKGAKDKGKEIIVSPGMSSGNTDVYWWLNTTDQAYRYNHLGPNALYTWSGLHSVNEALRADSFVDQIRFYTHLILNSDETEY